MFYEVGLAQSCLFWFSSSSKSRALISRPLGYSRDASRWNARQSPGVSRKYYCFEPPKYTVHVRRNGLLTYLHRLFFGSEKLVTRLFNWHQFGIILKLGSSQRPLRPSHITSSFHQSYWQIPNWQTASTWLILPRLEVSRDEIPLCLPWTIAHVLQVAN